MTSISTTALPAASALDEVLGNTIVEGVRRTRRAPIGDFIAQIEAQFSYTSQIALLQASVSALAVRVDTAEPALGALTAENLPTRLASAEAQIAGFTSQNLAARLANVETTMTVNKIARETWAALSGMTGTTAGQGGYVDDNDTGTHTDPVAGGTVKNAGEYSWSASPAGWRRIGDTLAQKIQLNSPFLENLWPDPDFAFVRSKGAKLKGRKLMYDIAGINGKFDPAAVHPDGVGAWVYDTALTTNINFFCWFDDLGVTAGDKVSIAMKISGPAGGIVNQYHRQFGPTEATLLGTSTTGTPLTCDGGWQIITMQNIDVIAGAKGISIWLNDGSPVAAFKISRLWVVKSAASPQSPPQRRSKAVDEARFATKTSTALRSLFPDPNFEAIRTGVETMGGRQLFVPAWNNRAWDDTIVHSMGKGGFKVLASSATLAGWRADFETEGMAPGDTFSLGCIIKAATAARTVNVACRQADAAGTVLAGSPQVATATDVADNILTTGGEQLFKIEAMTMDALAKCLVIYLYDGALTTDFHLLKLWVVKGPEAFNMPPARTHPALISYIAAGGQDITPAVSPDKVLLPPRINCVAGRAKKLFDQRLRIADGPRHVDWTALAGSQITGAWSLPAPAAGADTAMSVVLSDRDYGQPKGSGASTLSIAAANGPAGAARRVLFIGDSLTAAGTYTQRILDASAANASGVQVTLMGTKGAGANKHEGQGGWTVGRYHTPGVTWYASNPFTQNSADKFNFAYYLSSTAQAAPDIVVIALGINDAVGSTTDAGALSAALASMAQLDEIIGITGGAGVTSVKAAAAAAKFLIVPEPAGSNDQADFGTDYGTGIAGWRAQRNISIFNSALIDRFSGREADGVFLSSAFLQVDPDAGYSTSGVHPGTLGYEQMGDAISDDINVLVTKGLM